MCRFFFFAMREKVGAVFRKFCINFFIPVCTILCLKKSKSDKISGQSTELECDKTIDNHTFYSKLFKILCPESVLNNHVLNLTFCSESDNVRSVSLIDLVSISLIRMPSIIPNPFFDEPISNAPTDTQSQVCWDTFHLTTKKVASFLSYKLNANI